MASKFSLTLTNHEPVTVTVRIADMVVSEQEGQRRGWGPVSDLSMSYLALQLHKAARREHDDITPASFDDFLDSVEDFESVESSDNPFPAGQPQGD